MFKSDQPQTDEEIADTVAVMNKAFGFSLVDYAQVTKSFAGAIQSLNWFARMVCPTLVTAVSIVAAAVHRPSVKSVKLLKQMLRYTQGKRADGLHYRRPDKEFKRHEFPRMEYGCDSSFHDHLESGKSHGGVVGRIEGMAVTYFRAGRSSHVTTCSAHAESYQSAEAAKQIVYEKQLADELGFKLPTHILKMDNRAVITASTGELRRFSQRMKHYLLSERYLTQCVEAGFIEVKYTSTTDLDADAMTKALPGTTLERHAQTLEYGAAP
jgi:hypothetical protein